MSELDKRGKLDDEPFDYQLLKEGRVLLYWEGKHIKTLSGKHAEKFAQQIDGLSGKDEQLLLAKVTGNFKRGNERDNKR